jgi:hypothetical protein
LRDPDLDGSAGAIRVRSASEPAGVFEGAERAVDLTRFLVAAEQIADLGAAHAVGPVFGERPDVVGGGVTEGYLRRSRSRD